MATIAQTPNALDHREIELQAIITATLETGELLLPTIAATI